MIEQLMRAIPVDQIAQQLGEDPDRTRDAVQAALPAMLGGLSVNAQDPDGASSLLGALGQHDDGLADDVAVDRIDTQDGEKIVGHVFGDNTDGVVNQLGALSGGQSSQLVRRLLPILAPIVLSWLAKQVTGAGQRTSNPHQQGGAGERDMTSVLQDVLGSALGGATGQTPRSGSGNVLSDVLGGLLRGRS